MHLGMPECHKPFLGHCDLDLWPRFQELLYPEHISYIIWCRNPKFGVVIPLGMAEWCIPFWVTLTLTLASGLISSFFVLYYSYLSSNVSYIRPIPLGAFVTCLWHFLLHLDSYFLLYFPIFEVRKKANIRNWYNQVPYLTKDIVWESAKKQQENITYKITKRSALSQQVTSRLLRNRHGSMAKTNN